MSKPCQKLLPSRNSQGSAALDFVLVSVPLLLLSVTVISIFSAIHVFNLLRDSVVEGARFAAMADQTASSGCERARQVFESAVGPALKVDLICDSVVHLGTEYERVSARLTWQLIGVAPIGSGFFTQSKAPRELQ